MTLSNKKLAFRKTHIPKLLPTTYYLLPLVLVLLITGCSDKAKEKSLTEGGMKCGAGKCGAGMTNGSALLVKKKTNILTQLSQDDHRRACVLKAPTAKILYECVRDKTTGRLTTKYSTAKK